MDTVVVGHGEQHEIQHGPPAPPPRGWRRLTAPGWLRAAWMLPLVGGIGFGIVVGLRAWGHYEPLFQLRAPWPEWSSGSVGAPLA